MFNNDDERELSRTEEKKLKYKINSFIKSDLLESEFFNINNLTKEEIITLRDYIKQQLIKKEEFDRLTYDAVNSIKKSDPDIMKMVYNNKHLFIHYKSLFKDMSLFTDVDIINDFGDGVYRSSYNLRSATRKQYKDRYNNVKLHNTEFDEIFKTAKKIFNDSRSADSISSNFFCSRYDNVFNIYNPYCNFYTKYLGDEDKLYLQKRVGRKEIDTEVLDRVQIRRLQK